MLSAPVWLVAFVAAAAAPFAVSALQGALERRARRRTLAVIARAGLSLPATASAPDDEPSPRPASRGSRA